MRTSYFTNLTVRSLVSVRQSLILYSRQWLLRNVSAELVDTWLEQSFWQLKSDQNEKPGLWTT